MKNIIPFIGRLLFTLQFFTAMRTLFGDKAVLGAAASGFPFPEITAKLAALTALVGALSILIGYRAKFGAVLLIIFLLPVTFTMHVYWTIEDPAASAAQAIAFFKNINAIGGALLIVFFGAGPVSIDYILKKNQD